MKHKYLTPTLLAVAALLAACGSTPRSTSLLDQTRSEYRMAQSNPNVATYAALEMRQASDAMAQAEREANEHRSEEKVDKLAYLARQKIALAQEVAKQKLAEADLAKAGKERDQIRLDQRTNEANAAKLRADKSREDTLRAQGETAQAQRDTVQAQQAAAQAQQEAQLAQGNAANSQRSSQEAQVRLAQLEAQLAEIAAKKTARGMVITLGDVLFGTDQARLNSTGMETAQKLANILQLNPERTVLVEGFTDSTGSQAHNQELSERRAGAVRTALQDMGVPRDRIATHAYGESYPAADNDSAQNRQLNRRVEIVLSDDSGKIIAR